MCGIAGLIMKNGRAPSLAALEAMQQALAHRGPDGVGSYVKGAVGMLQRRLAIIDPETGDQPLANEDGTVVLVCNGEIYNHVELRLELLARGHRFRSGSDAETIVHLYEELGPSAVERLRGMFALALWDVSRRRLLLARDRLGIKSLVYAVSADGLAFASETKALLAAERVDLSGTGAQQSYSLGWSAVGAEAVEPLVRGCPGFAEAVPAIEANLAAPGDLYLYLAGESMEGVLVVQPGGLHVCATPNVYGYAALVFPRAGAGAWRWRARAGACG